MLQMRRSLFLLPLLLALASIPGGAVAKKPPPTRCADGRFRVEGPPLVTGGLVVPIDAVVVQGRQIGIDSGCGLRKANVKATRKSTVIGAQWPACGVVRKVRLKGRIASPACDALAGSVKAKGRPAVRFQARRSACADGVVDAAGGEQCERDADCAAGATCHATSCRCQPATAACGNGAIEQGEPCDVMATPSGCASGRQCDVTDGRCVCAPIPDPIGKIVRFTPEAPVDVRTLELPAGADGHPRLIQVPGGELTVNPARANPVTAFGRCAYWITACVSPPDRTIDDCARSAPPCGSPEPWAEAALCCPAACFTDYEALRRAGTADIAAFGQAYFDGACIPGLRALRGLP